MSEHCNDCAPEFFECWTDVSKCRKRPTMTTTTHKCPACGKQLSHTFDDYDNLIVWCASGYSCPSIKANAGITGLAGETFGQLARKLIAQLEAQPDWEDA